MTHFTQNGQHTLCGVASSPEDVTNPTEFLLTESPCNACHTGFVHSYGLLDPSHYCTELVLSPIVTLAGMGLSPIRWGELLDAQKEYVPEDPPHTIWHFQPEGLGHSLCNLSKSSEVARIVLSVDEYAGIVLKEGEIFCNLCSWTFTTSYGLENPIDVTSAIIRDAKHPLAWMPESKIQEVKTAIAARLGARTVPEPRAFRVWDKEKEALVVSPTEVKFRADYPEGWRINSAGVLEWWSYSVHREGFRCTVAGPDRFVVEEFTGFLDKSGSPIYEGDLVQAASGKQYYVVRLDTGGPWCLLPNSTHYQVTLKLKGSDVKIIGRLPEDIHSEAA